MRLKYVHEVNGCLYVRRVRVVKGKRVETNTRLPDMDAPNFWSEYQRIAGPAKKPTMGKNSLAELIGKYRMSSEYRNNATNTKKNKERYFDLLIAKWGPYNFTTITQAKVLEYRDEFYDTPGKADNLVTTLSSVLGWAVKRDLLIKNPCHDIDRLADGTRDPWPQEVMDKMLASAGPMLRLAIQAHYYTGQRIGDVCKMRRPKGPDAQITVVQEKTGKTVEIGVHRDFWTAIQAVPALPEIPTSPLLYGRNGQVFTPDALRDRLRTLMREHKLDYKFHGLRKNAVNALLEVGCTEYEVGSITGQTAEEVKRYAKAVDRKKMAVSAILKWESGKP